MIHQEVSSTYGQIRKIAGWFSKEAAQLLALLNEVQKKNQLHGDIFEIGVHHGKSALFLHRFLSNDEKMQVCDLFEDQKSNTSVSGMGDKAIFLQNIARILGKSPIQIHEKLSGELTVEEIGSSYRMFHIDGGHSFEEALADLTLASRAIHPYGIIILDDPFRSEWPGVTEAALEFLKQSPGFSPLAIGFNKLLLVRNQYHALYSQALDSVALRAEYGLGYPWAYKVMELSGRSLRCYYMPSYLQKPTLKIRVYGLLKRVGLK
jgi:hypothetical protein